MAQALRLQNTAGMIEREILESITRVSSSFDGTEHLTSRTKSRLHLTNRFFSEFSSPVLATYRHQDAQKDYYL
jgi:hypothetical protein